MRTLYITEEQERSLKNRVILAEADDRIKKVNKIIDAEFSNLLNLDEPVSGVEYYVNNNPETTWRAYLLFRLRHKFGLMTNADMKYLPFVAKLAYSDEVGFDKRNDNGNEIGILLKIVGLFKKDDSLFQKVKANINNITFTELYEQLKPQLEQSSMIDTHNANHVKTRDDYDVVEVPDFQTANFYGNKSCSVSKLCYTQNEHTWNEYTKNGINKVYVCLKHGWENIPEEVGEGNPYDEYGTSMIFVFIDPEGNITTSNCRWNHRTEGEYEGSVDHAFTKTTLCETIGKRFVETFKPHSTEYLMKKGYMPFDTVQELLDNGEKPEEIFNYCGDFYNGIACVKLNGKYNYINTNNQLISKTWFDYGGYFRKGFACVELYGKYNFINANGQIISDTWFDDCYAFYNGFAVVRLNGKWNFINTDGQIISNTWFDGCGIFKNGFARVELNNKYNFINTNGQLLSNTWFDDCGGFDNGFAIVKLNGKINYINTNGQIVESKGRKMIYITEEQRKKLNDLLLENEGTNMKRARKYLESKGYNPEQRQQILDSIRTDIPNSRLQQCKFLLGVTRLYMEGQLNNGNAIANLNKTLKYIASDAHVNEYDFNLNGENLDTLVDRFKGVAKDDLEQSRNASNARQLTVNNNYTVVPINDFEQSSKYGKYTSWCVTHDENMYNSYTNNGSGRFYFCLYKGFENEPKIEGEGCPLDNYGLSMIAVSVTMEGEVNTITCRWNHDNNGNDSIMTIEQLEDVIGRNFYQTFKPYTRDELHAKGVVLFDEVQELLDCGKKPEEIFDRIGSFKDGFACVILNNKYNFINTNNQLISDTWFDDCGNFHNGFAIVALNHKWNFINTNGQLISDTWFDDCGVFDDGVARVKLNGQEHYINTNGQIVESKGRKNKHIIITEEQEKSLKESILLNSFPEDIADAVYKNKTSIGNNPALPNIFEKGYVEKLVEKRFKGCVDELKKIGEIDDVPDTDMQTVLGKLVLKCQKLEEPHRPELEKIVANYLIDLFGIPDDSIQMELSLVDDVDLSSSSIKLDPADGDEFIEYEDVLDAESIKDEVYKRRLIDAISMGAGMKISSSIKDYMKEIYEINPTLIDLYRKILALNDYLLFTKEDIGMTEEDKHQFGTVEVVLGQVEESPKILAQGVIFPILLSEAVRGLMELFASHGLPQEFEKAQSVLSKSDYLKAEPWDMRIGPALWEIVSDSFGNGVKTDLIPYLYKRISQLPVKKFNFFMREVLAKTRKGKRMMAKIAEKAQYEKEYSGFEDKMSKFSTDKNVIMDEYIHPDEL